MMAVSAPVLPPSFDPQQKPVLCSSPGPSKSAVDVLGPPSPSPAYMPRGMLLEADVRKSVLPPTPDPSPPARLFPTAMVALAPPADDMSNESSAIYSSSAMESSASSSSSSHSTSESRSPGLIDANANSLVQQQRSPSPRKPVRRGMSASEASSSNRGSFSRVKSYDTKEREREQRDRDRRNLGRRQTTTGGPGPTSVRMVESRSADGRTRLRSTGGVKLTRYPTLATEYPSARLRRTVTHDNASPSTPPPSATNARPQSYHLSLSEPEQLDFGGPDGLEAKLVLLGSQGVGKTSLILRLTSGSFNAQRASASVEGSVYKRKLDYNGHPIKLQIWDTAGQERFRSMAPIYYRGAHVCILVYDISDRKSFQDVQSWLDELNQKASKDMMIYVVGAKLDLGSQRAVTLSEASRTIRRWLNPAPEPEPEPEAEEVLAPRSLFRSTSTTRPRSDSNPMASPQRRPHSMHGLASLMRAATDFDFDLSASTGASGSQAPTLVAPSPAPTVHFPPSLVTQTNAPGTQTSASSTASVAGSVGSPPSQGMQRRQQRVSFHGAALAEPTSATTAETAVASTANGSKHRLSTSRFSLSGMLGLARSPSNVSDAMANLSLFAETASPRSPRPSLSPVVAQRVRTESSPLLDGKRRSEDWSATGPGWGRGEGPSAADALEEFGAAAASQSATSPWAISSPNNLPVPRQRLRGGSLGRDNRLFDDESDDDEPDTWGIDIGPVRVGEVSSLTGEGVESLLRSISAQLIERKDKIEREHTLRRKNSVMLTDPTKDKRPAKKGFTCCA